MKYLVCRSSRVGRAYRDLLQVVSYFYDVMSMTVISHRITCCVILYVIMLMTMIGHCITVICHRISIDTSDYGRSLDQNDLSNLRIMKDFYVYPGFGILYVSERNH